MCEVKREHDDDKLWAFLMLSGGGYLSWEFTRAEHAEVQRKIIDTMRECRIKDEVVHLGRNFVWGGSIEGFYVTEAKQSSSEKLVELQEQMVEIVKKGTMDGEDWKDQSE